MNHINHTDLILQRCRHCNQKIHTPPFSPRQVIICPRCASQLNDGRSWSLNRLSILAITLLMLAPIAFWQPLISIHLLGSQINANVIEGIRLINQQGDPITASIVAFCAIAAPLLLPILVLSLQVGRKIGLNLRPILLVLSHIKEWVMLDVYLIALGIAAIKMQDYASVFIGHGLIAFITMSILSLLILIHMNLDLLWKNVYPIEEKDSQADAMTCTACHYTGPPNKHGRCQRCHCPVQYRDPHSLQKTWAALIAAMVLLFPANLMPISIFYLNGQRLEDTIYSGVVSLIDSGNWPIAIIVFIASILVPFIKIIIMILLLFSIHFNSKTDPVLRMKLLKFVSWIGRWSMLDLFVIALMMTLVNREQLMSFTMGPAALYFGTAVILTILAVEWLDSRLIWDSYGKTKPAK
ncbi:MULTISPECIES: paraquat-inducible protein A [Providencia]|uniref:paraquat-inducible protein A n=1 Tax=Providencia TaxID=586 RepID=UPI00197F004D|nr:MULTISPECIES: paraquat-inducible protein A [Providencia]MBN4866632.1 membrane integrity lipid transport subunit YebS [Providencia stuartii]MBN4876096.1 membrane integrity lipid transport subunit YebS [Providencia stuartii]MBN4880646.1 membrane integrity lipid transport subunit YebS [Providencia stuartii]MBN4885296.1 membrane integrity lipid transport subunit YebS [Providencia stuartii]